MVIVNDNNITKHGEDVYIYIYIYVAYIKFSLIGRNLIEDIVQNP